MPIKMDETAKKSFEIQTQVRRNAQETSAAMKDLYSWEKEMKQKEELVKTNGVNDNNKSSTLLPRSHMIDKAAQQQAERMQTKPHKGDANKQTNKKQTEHVKTPEEKQETAPDPKAQKLKEANEIKDVGNTHVKFQQYDLAMDEYTRAIEMCPDVAVFYANRALCYLKLERYEECIEDCDHAIQLDNLAVKAFYRRMQANECLGNHMDALKDCTTVLTIEPKNAEAKKSLERINERLRKNLKSQKGPNFTAESKNFVEIYAIDKPPYARSSKPMRRVPITDVIGPKETKTFQNLEISDDDIDKLFNSNCGPFVEVKKEQKVKPTAKEEKKSINESKAASSSEQKKLATELTNKTPSTITLTNSEENISNISTVNENTPQVQTAVEKAKKNKINIETEMLVPQNHPLPPAPNTTAQFYSHWKELPLSQKYQYLKSIDFKKLSTILGAGFDSDTLSDCLKVLHDYYLPNKEATTADTLLEISRNEQISILSLFMSAEDKKVLSNIVDVLQKEKLTTKENLVALKTNFNLG